MAGAKVRQQTAGPVQVRPSNPYARRAWPLWYILQSALPFLYAQESTPGPSRLRYKAPRVRYRVPPILDERPIDIYRSTQTIYNIPGAVPYVYTATPGEIGE
jgi:hypothetical protein